MTDERSALERRLQETADAAEAEWAATTDEPRYVRSRARTKDPSQVYSVRTSADAVARLRAMADERGVRPTALMRAWVLERLAQESRAAAPDDRATAAQEEDIPAPRLGPRRLTMPSYVSRSSRARTTKSGRAGAS